MGSTIGIARVALLVVAALMTSAPRAALGAYPHATRLVEPRALLLVATQAGLSNAGVITFKGMLDGMGLEVDVRVVVSNSNPLAGLERDAKPSEVEAAGGTTVGRYSAIIVDSRELSYEAAKDVWKSSMTAAQWALLKQYQRKYRVRSLSLNTWPGWNGVKVDWSAIGTHVQFTERGLSWMNDPAVKPGAALSTQGAYVVPADTADATNVYCTLRLLANDGAGLTPRGCAAAIEVAPDNDGTEMWHWFMVPTPWYPEHAALASASAYWVVRGVFTGERRHQLSMQIDDLFLATDEWTKWAGGHDPSHGQVRLTPSDMALLDAFQKHLSSDRSLSPAGSDIKYEWAFNGKGVMDRGGIPNATNVGDALAGQAKTNMMDFYWLSHSYTHPNFDHKPAQVCSDEMTINRAFAKRLFGDPLPSTWSDSSLVPPSISGMFNGPCLQAFRNANVTAEVGDNSRSELLPQTYGSSPYHGLWTNGTVNIDGHGSFIIPRFSTWIMYDNSAPNNNVDHFNHLQMLGGAPGDWDWDRLIEFEAATAARYVLSYRRDPYMFHQSNAMAYTLGVGNASDVDPATFSFGNKASLLMLWADAVVRRINNMTSLPIVTWTQAEMARRLQDRMAQDDCGFSATVRVRQADGLPMQVTGWLPTGADKKPGSGRVFTSCKVAVTGLRAPKDGNGAQVFQSADGTALTGEAYTEQEQTVYLPLSPEAPGPITVDLGLPEPTRECVPACSGHGTCDLASDDAWPRCKCENGWAGADCGSVGTLWGANWLSNPSFEDVVEVDGRVVPAVWEQNFDGAIAASSDPTSPAFNATTDTPSLGAPVDGKVVARVWRTNDDSSSGLVQYLNVNQAVATKIRISGWSRVVPGPQGEGVTGWSDSDYSVYVDAVSATGTWIGGTTANFAVGVHDWAYGEATLSFDAPVSGLFVYAMFRWKTGAVDFDAFSVQMEVPTAGPVSTDGRCGFNSPLNAVCDSTRCCSAFGWCEMAGNENCIGGQTISQKGLLASIPDGDCAEARCWPGTSGPCITLQGACYLADSSTGLCPVGSASCGYLAKAAVGRALAEAAGGVHTEIVEVSMTLIGVSATALSGSNMVQQAVEAAVAAAASAPDTKVTAALVQVTEGGSMSGGETCRVAATNVAEATVRIFLSVPMAVPAGTKVNATAARLHAMAAAARLDVRVRRTQGADTVVARLAANGVGGIRPSVSEVGVRTTSDVLPPSAAPAGQGAASTSPPPPPAKESLLVPAIIAAAVCVVVAAIAFALGRASGRAAGEPARKARAGDAVVAMTLVQVGGRTRGGAEI